MTKMTRLVISCSDRRLSQHLDNLYADGNTFFVRTAGANVHVAARTILELADRHQISEFIVLPHTDKKDPDHLGCGAMGYVQKSLTGEMTPEPAIERALVSQFSGIDVSNRARLEEANLEIQLNMLRRLIPADLHIKISGSLIDTARLETRDMPHHVLVVTPPTTIGYADITKMLTRNGKHSPSNGSVVTTKLADLSNCYYVQVSSIAEAVPDIMLFTSALHINDVRLLATEPRQKELVAGWEETLKRQPFMQALLAEKSFELSSAFNETKARRVR